jgi:phosphate transport system protein
LGLENNNLADKDTTVTAYESHTVKSYDQALSQMTGDCASMGKLVEEQLRQAAEALQARNNDIATETSKRDLEVNALESSINQQGLKMLALRQPMASDLRLVIGTLKIARDLERMGDYAANIAKRASKINAGNELGPTQAVLAMAQLAEPILHDALLAYETQDIDLAKKVESMDDVLDEAYNALLTEIMSYMQTHPDDIKLCTHLIFIAKNFERVGDRATNIAETVQFIVLG